MADKTGFVAIRINPQLLSVLKSRAAFNHRSISSEALYLIEMGLAAGDDRLRDLFKMMGMVNDLKPEDENPKS